MILCQTHKTSFVHASTSITAAKYYVPQLCGSRQLYSFSQKKRNRRIITVGASSSSTPTVSAASLTPSTSTTSAQDNQHSIELVYLSTCAATFFAAIHRQNFSVLAVPIQQTLGITLPQLGILQAAILVGYIIGQLPCGILADRLGGAHVLMYGLFFWSICNAAFSMTAFLPNPFVAMVVVRAGMGLAQSVLMPAIAAASAQWYADSERSSKTASAWAVHSVGAVVGLTLTPLVAARFGWQLAFLIYGLIGMGVAVVMGQILPSEEGKTNGKKRKVLKQQQMDDGTTTTATSSDSVSTNVVQNKETTNAIDSSTDPSAATKKVKLGRGALLLLCWTHSVIGFAFFVYQAWVPTFIYSLGLENLALVGALSSLPWVATAAVSILAGKWSDHLHTQQGWSIPSIRKFMQIFAFLGSLLLLPLILTPQESLNNVVAVTALTLALAAQGFNYSGFHPYCQEVARQYSGVVVGVSNTCGILMGLIGNIATGHLAASEYGFRAVFGLTVVMSVLSAATWAAFADGKPLEQ